MLKNQRTKNKGITLIALVITIVVLLILAAISIAMLTGGNSILKRAVDAKNESEKGQEKEIITLAYNSALTKKVSTGDLSSIKGSELNKELNNSEATARNDNPILVTFISSNRQYKVYTNGIIEYAGIKNENNNSLSISIIPIETESRAILLEVTAMETEPLTEEEKLQNLSDAELKEMFARALSNFWNDSNVQSWEDICYVSTNPETIENAYDILVEMGEINASEYINVYDLIIKNTDSISTESEIQILSDTEKKEKFTKALGNIWNEGEITWDDIFFQKKADTIQEVFDDLIEHDVIDINEYKTPNEFILKNVQIQSAEFTYTCNGETVTGEKAEFIMTNPSTITITATSTSNGKSTEVVWNEYPAKKIETYSTIKAVAEGGKNSQTITAKDNETVEVPAGFYYGTNDKVGKVSTGFVITDSVDKNGYSNGNEFVWIPIDKTNLTIGKTNKKMAEISSGTDYKGILYNLELDPTGNTIIDPETYNAQLPVHAHEATSNVYGREPLALTSDSSKGINQTSMQNDYNAMIASIKQYGGFYVARYEMGSNDLSKLGVRPVSSYMNEANGWYGLYSKAKLYTNPNVTSGMIWGSQYDAMLIYALSNTENISKLTANTNGNHSGSSLPTGVYKGEDSINNVYDLEGNMWEFTQELEGLGCRSLRGGFFYDTWYHPVSRSGRIPGYNYFQEDSTRVMLYINV